MFLCPYFVMLISYLHILCAFPSPLVLLIIDAYGLVLTANVISLNGFMMEAFSLENIKQKSNSYLLTSPWKEKPYAFNTKNTSSLCAFFQSFLPADKCSLPALQFWTCYNITTERACAPIFCKVDLEVLWG